MRCKNENHSCNSCGEKKCGNKHTTCHNADVVEVVRCKDCEHRNTPDCYLWYGSIGDIDYIKATTDDFYCSYGKREQPIRDKQIEEMAKDIKVAHDEQRYLTSDKSIKAISEYLYNAGYRKASDVVRDIFNDLNEMWHKGRGFINYSDLVRLERLHEQKYESEGEG